MIDAQAWRLPLTEERLAEVVRRLAAELSPRAIYLFGSHAYGTPRADSDIDLMVVVADTTDLSVEFLQRAYACLHGSRLPIELHFRTESALARRGSVCAAFEHDVVTRGRRLYVA
jgi:predicted nucleotidyltransferase